MVSSGWCRRRWFCMLSLLLFTTRYQCSSCWWRWWQRSYDDDDDCGYDTTCSPFFIIIIIIRLYSSFVCSDGNYTIIKNVYISFSFSLFSKRRTQKLFIVTHNNLQDNVTKHFYFWGATFHTYIHPTFSIHNHHSYKQW